MTETQFNGLSLQTEIRKKVFILDWTIDNLSKLSKKSVIKSPKFHPTSTHAFYAEFMIADNGGCLWFYHISGPDIIIEHNVFILQKNGNVRLKKISSAKYSLNKSHDLMPSNSDTIKEVLKENTLFLKCVLEFDENYHHTIRPNPVLPLDDMSALSKDLKSLYVEPLYPDITLKIGDSTVPAHKNILAARSSVFARMFETPMQENEKNIVNIPDLDSTTVRNLLSYLYTAVMPCDDFDSACSLYYAGDKYNVPSLCGSCCSIILSKMDVQNVCRVLSLADQHSDAELKEQALRFVDFHFEEVLLTESWKELVKSSSELAVEVAVLCSGRSKKIKDEKVQE